MCLHTSLPRMYVSGPLPLFNSLAPGFLLFFFDALESDAVYTGVALTH